MEIFRTRSFTAKLSRATHARREAFLEEMRVLWNAAREERIDAYRKAGVSVSWQDQFKSLTVIRRDEPGYSSCALEAQRSVLRHLDWAFQGFFRRVKAGRKPGFPRFRSKARGLRSFSVPMPKIHAKGRWNAVSVKGIGRFRFLGDAAAIEGGLKTLRIVKTPRASTWKISRSRTCCATGAWRAASPNRTGGPSFRCSPAKRKRLAGG